MGVKWEDRPEQKTLCRGCKRFTPKSRLFIQLEKPNLGLCLQSNGVLSNPVSFKIRCPCYECNYPTRYDRILQKVVI